MGPRYEGGAQPSRAQRPAAGVYVADIDITEMARIEVEGLHDFFTAWFRGDVPESDEGYARFTDSLHPDFSMVVTTGVVLDRSVVLAAVRSGYRSRGESFRIVTQRFRPVVVAPDAVLATYEEWQFDGDELLTARTSTASFVADSDAPEGVAWRHLHETLQPTPRV